MSLAMIIDTETARIRDPVPVEVALIPCTVEPHLLDPSAEHPVFERRYNPGCEIEYGAIAAHNILPSDVQGLPVWEPHINIASEYVVGHNVDFDLTAFYGSADLVPSRHKRICTLALSRWAYPDIDSHKLAAMMYCVFGMTEDTRRMVREAHGALPDAYMCMRLVQFFAEHFKLHTWEDLYQQSEIARLPTRMNFGKYGPKDGQPGMPLTELVKDRGYVKWLFGLPDLDPYLRKALENLAS